MPLSRKIAIAIPYRGCFIINIIFFFLLINKFFFEEEKDTGEGQMLQLKIKKMKKSSSQIEDIDQLQKRSEEFNIESINNQEEWYQKYQLNSMTMTLNIHWKLQHEDRKTPTWVQDVESQHPSQKHHFEHTPSYEELVCIELIIFVPRKL